MSSSIGLFGGQTKKRDYLSGMKQLGIPFREGERISASLREGKLPIDVLDTIITGYESIAAIHPDDFPWHSSVSDELSVGFDHAKIDTGAVWKQALAYARENYQRDLPPCAIEIGASIAVTNLLEKYALISFHSKS